MNIELQVKNLFTNASRLDEAGFIADFYYIAKEYARQQNGAKPIVSGSLPPDVTLKDIKEIRNYFGEHDATLFEHRAFSIISRLINHIEATGGNDR